MAAIPSGVLPGAAVAAVNLARIVGACGASLSLPPEAALALARSVRAVGTVQAPRIRAQDDVAALGARLVAALQAAVRAADPADAAPALYAAAARAVAAAPVSASPVLTRQYRLARALAASLEAAALGEAFLAEARSDFADRPSAEAARARIDAALTGAADRIAARLGVVIAEALATAAREATVHLIERAVTLRPVIQVEAARSAPSTALAWALYGDPARAPELLARNRCGTPLFLPARLDALAPTE